MMLKILDNATRLVFGAQLVIDSVLHIGGGMPLDYVGAASLFRDGRGRPVIPGTSLAGLLVERLRPLLRDSDVWRKVTGKELVGEYDASCVEVATLPLIRGEGIEPSAIRDCVRINLETRTASDGGKFALEVLEPGLRFDFLIAVDLSRLPEADASELVAALVAVLGHRWSRGFDFVGGHSARGPGWFHLEDLACAAVNDVASLRRYLNSPGEREWLAAERDAGRTVNLEEIPRPRKTPAQVAVWRLTVEPRHEQDGWGVWPLLVRSSEGAATDECDFEFTRVRRWRLRDGTWEGTPIPVIPGSSLRGAALALLSRLAASGQVSWSTSDVQRLFALPESGQRPTAASRLRFRDAYVEGNYREVRQERLALDEFTRAALKGAKFNVKPVFSGAFRGAIALQPAVEENERSTERRMIEALVEWGGTNAYWLGVGAGNAPALWSFEESMG